MNGIEANEVEKTLCLAFLRIGHCNHRRIVATFNRSLMPLFSAWIPSLLLITLSQLNGAQLNDYIKFQIFHFRPKKKTIFFIEMHSLSAETSFGAAMAHGVCMSREQLSIISIIVFFFLSLDNNSLAESINELSAICTTAQLRPYQVKSNQSNERLCAHQILTACVLPSSDFTDFT